MDDLGGKPTIFGNIQIYHLESRWLNFLYWFIMFIMAPHEKTTTFWGVETVIYASTTVEVQGLMTINDQKMPIVVSSCSVQTFHNKQQTKKKVATVEISTLPHRKKPHLIFTAKKEKEKTPMPCG